MKIICIGRNYVDHIKELNNSIPDEPVLFLKPETSLLNARFPFFIPSWSHDIHYEAELVLRISKPGKNIEAQFAHRYFDQITVGIDFTARDIQSKLKEKGLPWEKAKAFDNAAAVGQFKDFALFAEKENIHFHLEKNGETVQKGDSSCMINNFGKIIEEASKYFTLKKGDYIFTGTPAGVGPVKRNDKLEAFLEGEKVLSFNIK